MIDFKKNFKLKDIMLLSFVNLNDEERSMVRKWRNHDSVKKWTYNDHIITSEEHINYILKLAKDNKNFYWLVAKGKDEYTGVIYLNSVDFKNKNAYLGIYSNPELKGLGNLLMGCLLEVSFKIAGLHTLKLEVMEDNQKALKLYKRFGFEKEGELKDFVFKNGKYKNVIIMGLINKHKKGNTVK